MAETLKIIVDVDVKGGKELKVLKTSFDGIGKAATTSTKGINASEKSFAKVGKAAAASTKGIDASSKSMSRLNSTVGKLAAGGLLLGAGKALLSFGKASITAASDVEEMQSKFNTVFKDLAGDVTKELQTFADAANRSIFDLQGFAATLQDTFVPLGFARDEAAKMSVQLVKLAEDLASFNNVDTETVVQDLQSALVGNTETLRKYGVVATQAAIDQEALAMGMTFVKGQMDAQTKAAAILSLTLKSTTDAQGDAIKTGDSYANQLKGLQAATQELQVIIGTGLLPAMTELVVKATAVADALKPAAAAMSGEYSNAVESIVDGNLEAAKSMDQLITEGQKIEEVANIFGGLGGLITGTSGEITASFVKTANAIAKQSATFEEFQANIEEAFGDKGVSSLQRFNFAQEQTTEAFFALAQAEATTESADRALRASFRDTTTELEAAFVATDRLADNVDELSDKFAQNNSRLSESEAATRSANAANKTHFETLRKQAAAAEEAAAAQQLFE